MRKKKKLSVKEMEELDDETYYYIQFLQKQIGELNHKLEISETTLRKVQDLINSNEDFAYFYSSKKEATKPIDDYFKKAKK